MDIPGNFRKVQIVIVCLVLMQLVACQDDPQTENVEVTTNANKLDADKCMKKRRGCCDEMQLGAEETLMKCFTLHQSKLPAEGETDPLKLIRFVSCFVECLYKQKKYLGKGDTINMKMVRSDAEKMYPNRPKEKEYHIAMFEYCKKDAINSYNLIKLNPAAKILFREACRPFYMFVFLCQVEYHKKTTCPYFKWEGKKSTPAESDCRNAKEDCYEIDGISL